MDLPIIPDAIAAEAKVQITFATSVNPGESGYSSRKSYRDQAIRNYFITVGPDDADEMMAMQMAVRGARWPLAIRDYANNYILTDEPQAWTQETDGAVINLSRLFTPSTGTRSYSQRILIVDQRDIAFSVKINGIAATSGTWALSDPGVLTVQGLSSGDLVTVSGNYLVPVTGPDMLEVMLHTPDTFEVSDIGLTEILQAELVDLTS